MGGRPRGKEYADTGPAAIGALARRERLGQGVRRPHLCAVGGGRLTSGGSIAESGTAPPPPAHARNDNRSRADQDGTCAS
ncbi:hypothetical protein [Streptomyces sp. NPDC093094]|uniref:hypothetical protein n=1 Tax=Streptomyces sp. NPDC093094 TaxID=3366026 RepID=UPI003829FC66